MDRILRNKIANLIEDAKALKRGGGSQPISFDELLENNSEEKYFSNEVDDPVEKMHLSIDLKHVMQKLPESLVHLLTHLGDYNPSEISRMTNTPRSTLYGSINVLRKIFHRHGMNYYF
ncbi:MAG: sigma-70 family RNA polymerase sigma factor [Alphaproteobacteria bacterium]|nr:sigma-70 family RNA polymerase sigma factor [Alphaproteobacteria bacterium]